jgi:hypothetical protein
VLDVRCPTDCVVLLPRHAPSCAAGDCRRAATAAGRGSHADWQCGAPHLVHPCACQDETCPLSTGGRTRRVQLVRGGEGGGGGAAPRPSMRVPGASPDTAPASVAAARARAPATRRPLRQPRPRFRSQRRRPRAEGARTLARTRLRPSDSAAQAPRHSAPRRDQAQRGQTGGVEKVSNIRTFDVLGVGERPAARSFAQRWCSGRARCAGRRGARGAAGGRPEGGRRTRRVRLVRGEGRNVSS